MEDRTVNNLPPANDGTVRCLLAIELSKKNWIVAITTAPTDRISSRGGPTSRNDLNRDRKSTRLNSSHIQKSRMPSSA